MSDTTYKFEVNQKIVYPSQGVGKITEIKEKKFKDQLLTYYVIYLEVSDMVVMVPVNRVEELGIRAIVSAEEAQHAIEMMGEEVEPITSDWKLRYQMNLDLLKKGSVADIATIVRCLYHRSKIKELPILERKLYDSAKKLLEDEISFALDKPVKETKPRTGDKNLFLKKLAASAGMIAMVIAVMKVKSPKDFVKKLQFTGPVTSGNAIKTVYAANIVGRFMAADDDNELRESVTRDYFGFLNWLVFGGFAAKGVANLLDRKKENLFNISKPGKGLKHWLNDVNLKTHTEIAAKGAEFARKNLWKLNAAHISGLLYSGITLGYLLPMINAKLTKAKAKKQELNHAA